MNLWKPTVLGLLVVLLSLLPIGASAVGQTLSPTDDTHSNAASGSSANMQFSLWEHAYIRYDLTAVNSPVTRALLKIYYLGDVPVEIRAWAAASDSWNEDSGTPDDVGFPWRGSPLVSQSATTNDYVELDITGFIQQEISNDGIASLELSNDKSGWQPLGAKEGVNPPQLIIETDGDPGENQNPIANFTATPGAGNVPLDVQFDAGASHDPDGGITRYDWDFGDGNTAAGINVAHRYSVAGVYTAILTVTDNLDATDTETTTITVNSGSGGGGTTTLQPTDDTFSRPGHGAEPSMAFSQWDHAFVRFDLGAVNGDVTLAVLRVYYQGNDPQTALAWPVSNDDWSEFGAPPEKVGFAWRNTAIASAAISAPGYVDLTITDFIAEQAAGDNIASIELSNLQGQWRFLSTKEGFYPPQLIIETAGDPGENQAPIAHFTIAPDTGAAALDVQFDASDSNDPDGSITAYHWDFGDGNTAGGITAAHRYSDPGDYTVVLTVTDNLSATDTGTGEVSVLESEPLLTDVMITPGSVTLAPGETQLFTATGIDQFGEDFPVTPDWSVSGGGSIDVNGVFTATTVGGPFTVTAADGAIDGTAQITVEDNPPENQLPAASLTATPRIGNAPLNVQFDASGSIDPDGGIVDYSWNFGDGNTADGINAASTYLTPGVFTVTLTVTDNLGATDTDTATITVNSDSGGGGTLTLQPTDDTFSLPGRGAEPEMAFSQWDHAFVRFDLSGANGDVTSATLRVYSQGSDAQTVVAWPVENDNWSEFGAPPDKTGFPWENTPIADTETFGPGYLDLNITDFIAQQVAGDRVASIELSSLNGQWRFLGAKEGFNPPELVIETTQGGDPVLSDISVTPASSTLLLGQEQLFVASGTDQFGDSFPVTPGWSVTGGGSIDANGVFTATTVGGPFTVSAADGTITGNAGIFVAEDSGENQTPSADFTANPGSGNAPLSVQFDANNSYDPDGSIVDYSWDFGDGDSGNGLNIDHTYTTAGAYSAVLTVTDDLGATDTSFTTITVSNGGGQTSNILINEFMAANKTTLADPDEQKFGDWIELYNSGNSSENIGGFYLSDDPQESPSKWRIPDGVSIEAGGYLLIWADGADKSAQALHSNFKLSKSGESVGIRDRDGALIDAVSFAAQSDDISLGRSNDGASDFVFFTSPTPGSANDSGSVQVDPPELSLTAGFYNGPQLITISTSEPGATVGYTRDGSEPAVSSGQSAIQITVDTTSAIRARTFKAEVLDSLVVTNTYLIDENTTLPVFSISTDPDNLYGAAQGILHPDNIYRDIKRPVQTEFFEAQGDRQFTEAAEIKLSGKSSLELPNKSFALRARGQANSFNYRFFADKEITEFKSLLLRTSGQDQATSLLRGGMMQTLLIGQMDIDRLAYQPAIVFLNGEYYGIRNIREKKNEHYLHDNHGVDKDRVDVLQEFNHEVVEGNSAHYESLLDFVRNNDIRQQANYDYVATQMDISEYINYYLAEIYFANKDWPVKNIRFWRAQDGGKWRWIFYDLDLAFGIYGSSASVNMFDFLLSNYAENYNQQARLLFKKLMENDQFRNELAQRLAGHLNTTFAITRVQETTDRLAAVIRPEIPAHMAYWYPNGWPNPAGWEQAINSLKDFAADRPAYVRQHLDALLGGSSSGFAELQIQQTQPDFGQVFINTVPIPPQTSFNGQWLKDIPLTLKAVAAPGKRFVRWEGATNGTGPEITISLNGSATVNAVFADINIDAANLVITEIHYNPLEGNGHEFLELFNAGSDVVDLSGYSFSDGVDFIFPAGATINAQQLILIANDASSYSGLGYDTYQWTDGKLSNKGEAVTLIDSAGNTIDTVSYDDEGDWPIAADGAGPSLELINPALDNNTASNWQASLANGGSPGFLTSEAGFTPPPGPANGSSGFPPN